MSEFSNVTVVKEANIFFNGGVTSRTIIFSSGSKKTLGIMMRENMYSIQPVPS